MGIARTRGHSPDSDLEDTAGRSPASHRAAKPNASTKGTETNFEPSIVCVIERIKLMKLDELISEILALPHHERTQVLNSILLTLDTHNCETEKIWAREAHRRWLSYKAGRVRTVSYEEVTAKYKDRS